ncbi:GEVED domain-containing protein [Flavobacterium orientale]|uniref:Fibronectin type-III domain-containing protein n=1 Tax=Flavobacterium orientale TaxID=1756020 RepID=A0A916XW70_9FLAO|nr:GEVED domain-containing protein [Flavobacterium orientale]GGD16717.1 hypothetical protein GCM10011343_04470 [Flavobacterium orientale]
MKKITFFKVKKWYLLFLLASISYFSNGQCVNTIPYLTETSNNSGNVQNISSCTYSTEYNTINGLVIGENYIFTATSDGVDKYVSITDTDNVTIAHGSSPLVVNSITVTAVRLHVTNSAACDGGSICHVTTIQLLADCPAPVSLDVIGLSTTGATLFWTPIGTETAWDLQYGLTGFDLGTGTFQNNLASANFDAINLLPGTTYQFYVRAKCSTEDSLWAGPFSFTTVCLAVTEFAENFDSNQGGFNSQLPNCWEKGGNGTIYLESFGVSTPFSAPNAIYMYSSDFDGQSFISYALMPLTSNLQANTHRLRFKAYSTTGTDRFLEVGYLTNASDVGSFVSMEEISLPGTSQASAQQFIVIPNNLPVGAVRLAIMNSGYPGNSTTIFIDDVFWEAIPTCIEPSDVSASNVLATTATINWDAASVPPANGYEYYISDSSTAPTGATTPSGSVGAGITSANVINLTPVTQYFVWVRSVCAVGDYSYWTSIATFTTPCAAFTPYYGQDFSTFDFNPDSLPCWERYGQGDLTTGPTGDTNSGSWFSDGWLNNGFSGAAKINIFSDFIRGWLVTPVFDLTIGGYQVKYDVGATQWGQTGPISAGGVLGSDDFVYFVMSTDGGTTWTTLETYSATNTPSNLGTTKVYNIPATTSATVKFAFYGTSGDVADDADVDFFVDNFIVQAIPLTAPDCATNVEADIDSSCGNFETELSWDVVSGSDGYKLTIGTTSGGNEIVDNLILNATSYSFVGNFNTTYYFKVVPFNAIGDAVGCAEVSFTTAVNGCYCVPEYETGVAFNDLMSNFVINGTSLSHNSGTSTTAPSYNYYTGQPNFTATLVEGTTYTITPTVGFNNQAFSIWIDFNDNLTFEESERVGFTASDSNINTTGGGTFTITIPCNAAIGLHRMRVRMVYAADGNTIDPCSIYFYGEVEDYDITIAELSAPTGDAVQTINVSLPAEATIEDLIVIGTGIKWFASEADAIANINQLPVGTALVDGTTYYAVSSAGSCNSDAFAVTAFVTLSVGGFDSSNFSYYPNPVKDIFSFSYNNVISDVKVFNLLGQQVIDAMINATQGQIDVSGLSNGAYLVRFTCDNQVKTIKIIKN